ncbi:hypothetical protein A1Q2_01680 [Trichosporon asahii var. asahii CBS 8904]|uniref:Peptidase S59 domain-containing protein n=1 Tax=Trichosporon asahii var. asahii (strain CBS 8904) TaxID=1220162 RepID=K1VTX7_TRIAC|nr:hypothetical protein A1Q2_01680 [Trichosporon asahii var. asahii CBS 8904]
MFGSTWGQNNQQKPGGLFGSGTSGGFGQSSGELLGRLNACADNSGGFGQQQNTGGFGQQQQQQNTGGGLFGSTSNQTSGFGSGGFGQQNNQQTNSFGARPTFGATGSSPFGGAATNTGGGLFGSNNNTSTFGSNTGATSSFGNNNASSGGLFGSKPATGFGSTTSSGGLFGQPQTSTFGSTQNAAGPSNQVHNYTPGPLPPCPQTGTAAPPYQPTWQRDPSGPLNKDPLPPHLFHVITAMDAYKGGSFEELRMLDYQQNRKEPTAQPAAATGGFGQTTSTTGGFGSTGSTFGQPAQQNTGFGAKPAGGLFGSTSGTTSGFGNTSGGFGSTSGGFGQQNNTGSVFGQQQNANTGGFGQAANTNTGGGLFGQQQNNTSSGGLFGSANNNTTSGFGQNNQQQGTTTGFGGFGAKPAFGSTSTTSTGFGQTNNATGFGQTNTGSTGFGFGQQNQQQQQQPQQSTGGLFGSTTNNAFGQNNAQQNNTLGGGTSLFGQNNQQQTNTTGGLFGNTANKPAGGLFGSTPAATTGTTGGFGGFGQNNTTTTTQPATGGLFGNNAATTTGTTGGGLFGNTTNTTTTQPAATGGLFGNTTNTASTGGGLFGAKPATTTGGLFGSTTTTQPATTGTGFGGFGQQQNNATTGGGLFGNTAANNQAQAKPAGSLFGGGGSSLFGAQNNQQTTQPAAGGSLFGGLNQSQPAATGGLFGSTASTTQPAAGQTGGLFGSTLGQSTAQQPSLTASVDQNPYGKNELFAYSGQKLEVGSTNKKPALPPLTASSYRVTPSKGRVVKLRGFASPLNASQSSGRASSPSLASPSRSVIGSPAPSDRYNGLTDAALSPNAFIPRPNVKKITVTPKANAVNSEDPLESVLGKSQLRGSVNGNGTPATPDQGSKSPTLSINNGRALTGDDTPTRRSQPIAQESIRAVTAERPLKRGDYWCRPKLEKLRSLSHQELSKLENFTVGRKGYGEVTFLQPVDLTDLPSLQDLFGKTVIVEDLELTVYPDDSNKPPRGQGLNVPAQISLENCFARDKATRQPITDPNDPRYRRQIKRVKAVQGTEFVDFSDDGIWTFTVEHFSRYGLADSDEESDEGMNDSPSTGKGKQLSPDSTIEGETESEEDDFLPPTKSMHDRDVDMDHDSGLEETGDSYDEADEEEDDESFVSERRWENPVTNNLDSPGIRRVRLMQSNFFANQEVAAPAVSAAEAQRTRALEAARALQRGRAEAGFGEAEEDMNELDDRAVKRASFGELASPPPRQPRKYAKVPLAESSVNGNEGVRPDTGLALGRSFRCSWGPNGELVHFGKICAPKAEYKSPSDATVFVQQVDLLADSPEIERPKADRLLSLLLDNSQIEQVDGTPMAMTSTEIRFKEFARLFDEGDRSHEATIWRLGKALFDEIDLRLPPDTPDDVRERVFQVRRKLALSKWLEDAVAPAVDGDLAAAGDNRPAKLFSLLTGNQTDRAVQSALDGKDMRLATLVSQAGGPEVFRSEVLRQLDDWTKFKANSVIGYDYRRLYALLAGITDVSKGDSSRGADAAPDVLVAEGLDWKRAFGLYLWHGRPFEETIGQVFGAYTHALDDAHPPAKPIPPYLEKPDGEREWNMATKPTDVLYNLIRMFVDLTVPLEEVLSARGCSPSPTDLRLPWHLYLLLTQALEARDFSDREEPNAEGIAFSASANELTRSYAAQLEEEGQWTWAAFVLLHLELPEARRNAVRELLFRHPNPNNSERMFLVNTLRIPPAWLHEVKAAEFATENDPYREYFELIRAGLADRAQRLLITKLAPEAILRDSQSLLRRLCEALEPLHPTGWEYGGKLFLDYLNIINDTKPLLASVLRAGLHPDPVEDAELNRLCKSVPRVIQLLPALFPNKDDVQQVASLSEMLSNLQNLGAVLHMNNRIERPPISDLLVDKDRLHLLQGAATESFERSLSAIMA